MHAWARYTRDRTRTRPHAAAGARPRAKAQLDGADVAGEGRTRLLSDAVEREERRLAESSKAASMLTCKAAKISQEAAPRPRRSSCSRVLESPDDARGTWRVKEDAVRKWRTGWATTRRFERRGEDADAVHDDHKRRGCRSASTSTQKSCASRASTGLRGQLWQ